MSTHDSSHITQESRPGEGATGVRLADRPSEGPHQIDKEKAAERRNFDADNNNRRGEALAGITTTGESSKKHSPGTGSAPKPSNMYSSGTSSKKQTSSRVAEGSVETGSLPGLASVRETLLDLSRQPFPLLWGGSDAARHRYPSDGQRKGQRSGQTRGHGQGAVVQE